jgi:hypothetical protein
MSHIGELRNLYSSPDIVGQIKSRRMRWAGHVAHMGEGRNVYRLLMGMPEGMHSGELHNLCSSQILLDRSDQGE